MVKINSKFSKVYFLLFAILIHSFCSYSQSNFSPKTYGNVSNYFTDTTDMQNFFKFKSGQTVAEVGTYDAQNLIGFSTFTDHINYYAQDINASQLNDKKLLKRVNKTNPGLGNGNTIQVVIGKLDETLLPDNYFDKIILVSTFHEFTEMEAMITDIHSKLRTAGKLYILETTCLSPGHINYSAEEAKGIIEPNGFKMIRQDERELNESDGLYRQIYIKK